MTTLLVPLSNLAGELARLTGAQVPSYRALWNRVVDGTLPAVKQANGRYQVDPVAAAAALGLTIQTASPQ
jgi:hypothetical protein